MKYILINTLLIFSFNSFAQNSSKAELKSESKANNTKGEVLENPTLKTLSGALNSWSFYSSFSYKAGSLESPFDAERPNITSATEKPALQSMSGNLGIKYRITKQDNLSLQIGAYMTTPFHSSHTASNAKIQSEFDNNHQQLDLDDPTLSYFRTYKIGTLQNVTFLQVQKVTRGVMRDSGYDYNTMLSHAAAYLIKPGFYVAGTFSYGQAFFDSETMLIGSSIRNIRAMQTEKTYKAALSTEFYPTRKVAIRAITDVASYFQYRDQSFENRQKRVLQQTLAMTYFFTRDISIAPSINFIADDIRTDRTNVGVSMNINL